MKVPTVDIITEPEESNLIDASGTIIILLLSDFQDFESKTPED